MIRNRNLIFGKAGNSSPDADKYIDLPNIATASRPTAAAAINGAIYYDTTANVLKACVNGSWVTIDTTGE